MPILHTRTNDEPHLLSALADCWQLYPWSGWIIPIYKLASITEHLLYLSERIRKQLFFTARGYWTADEIVYGAAIVCNLTNKCKLLFPDSTGREQQWNLTAWCVQDFEIYLLIYVTLFVLVFPVTWPSWSHGQHSFGSKQQSSNRRDASFGHKTEIIGLLLFTAL